jgi:hypothetical protein
MYVILFVELDTKAAKSENPRVKQTQAFVQFDAPNKYFI